MYDNLDSLKRVFNLSAEASSIIRKSELHNMCLALIEERSMWKKCQGRRNIFPPLFLSFDISKWNELIPPFHLPLTYHQKAHISYRSKSPEFSSLGNKELCSPRHLRNIWGLLELVKSILLSLKMCCPTIK